MNPSYINTSLVSYKFTLKSILTVQNIIMSSSLLVIMIIVVSTFLQCDKIKTTFAATTNYNNLDTYIVQVEPNSADYKSFMSSPSSLRHSYQNVFPGFAAKLSKAELELIKTRKGVISVTPERIYSLHTTHTPQFLGLSQNLEFWNISSTYGKGVVIGLLDTGISPTHPSFDDSGMPPPPSKWKGRCEFSPSQCNNKLIGARSFIAPQTQPFDIVGHGSHTASTAAGNFVQNANIFGNANGTASGMAPYAHIAMYKVCDGRGCFESDILAGIESAIADGVDVLSISLGGVSLPFYGDFLSIATYSAMEKGIFISCSAGNGGPHNQTLSNEAPWILTVGASTIDRKIVASAVLGDNQQLDGQSAFQPQIYSASSMLPLIFPGINTSDVDTMYCMGDSMKNFNVTGKILVCLYSFESIYVDKAANDSGAAAVIYMNQEYQGYTTFAEAHILPATHISYVDGLKLRAYLNSTSKPIAKIVFKGTIIGDDRAPVVASFSSRGPSLASPGVLKPDIIGPGVDILAAWPVSVDNQPIKRSTFNLDSGTSMSCPHLSGIAALLKSIHSDWSPAAIKSAMMTTADVLNLAGKPIEDQRFLDADMFATGAGHVNPSKATDPGLVYDLQPEDYIPYLCGLNYTDQQVGSIIKRGVNCSEESSIPQAELNYPSFALSFSSNSTYQTYTRTATNVGDVDSSYSVEIAPPPGIEVTVQPTSLNFSKVVYKIKYSVTFSRLETAISNTVVQGYLKWISPKYSARSPVVVILLVACIFFPTRYMQSGLSYVLQ